MKSVSLSFLLILASLLMPGSLAAQENDAPPDPLAIFLHQFEAINNGDLEGSLTYIREDTVNITLPPPPGTNSYEIGVDAQRAINSYLIGNHAQFEILETQVNGNVITYRFLLTEDFFRQVGVYPIAFRGSAVVYDGRIVSDTLLMDERDNALLSAAVGRMLNEQVLDRFYREIWSEGNMATIDEIIGDDFIDHFSGENGRETFRNLVNLFRTAFPDLDVTYNNVLTNGELIVAEVAFTGTYAGGFGEVFGVPDSAIGKEITLTGVDYVRIVDGQYVEGWGSHDDLGWFQQFGMELKVAE